MAAGPITNTFYDVVDGQQRIDAIHSYHEGAFALLDPSDDSTFRFPIFVKDTDCPWGGKRYSELSPELQRRLLEYQVVVYEIGTDNENYIRDLFIRLQGGTPLTAQDKRDSWPGQFTEFILQTGGKKEVDKWPGLALFREIAAGNESRKRQLAAQVFMLFWTTRRDRRFCDIKTGSIDAFYHAHVGFDRFSNVAKRFERVCKKLHDALAGKPRVTGHYVIHLTLLVDSLADEYVPGWEKELARCLYEFDSRRRKAAEANKQRTQTEHQSYYTEYGQWTQTRSDDANTIRRRHAFFAGEMLSLLQPTKRDNKRQFSALQRETVFYRDMESCQWCGMQNRQHKVEWSDCEIHHVLPHTDGGETKLANAALVHRDCHPKRKEDVDRFGDWWSANREMGQST